MRLSDRSNGSPSTIIYAAVGCTDERYRPNRTYRSPTLASDMCSGLGLYGDDAGGRRQRALAISAVAFAQAPLGAGRGGDVRRLARRAARSHWPTIS